MLGGALSLLAPAAISSASAATMTGLGTLGSEGHAINDRGQVTGGLAVPAVSGSLFLTGFFGYALFPTLFSSILCPSLGAAIVVANLLNLIVGFAASKRGNRPHWLTNWLSVTSVLSGVYLSAHFVLTAFFLNLGLHC